VRIWWLDFVPWVLLLLLPVTVPGWRASAAGEVKWYPDRMHATTVTAPTSRAARLLRVLLYVLCLMVLCVCIEIDGAVCVVS
jgi:hypothetical protein